MEKIIIVNKTNLPMQDIMIYAGEVIEQGRISNNGKSYCYLIKFHNNLICSAQNNKQSDTLTFWNE